MGRLIPQTLSVLMISLASTCLAASIVRAQATTPAVQPIFLAFGGYGSCLRDQVPSQSQLGPIITSVSEQVNDLGYTAQHVIYTCFHMTAAPMQEYVTYSYDNQAVRNATVADFLRDATALLATWNAGKQPIFGVGHSHGAWLLLALQSQSGITFTELATLDPINYETCSGGSQRAALSQALSGGNPSTGCTQFRPRFALPTVPGSAQHWLNAYQTRCSFLHGQELEGADNWQDNDKPLITMASYNGLDELIGTGLPGVDPGRFNLVQFMSRLFQDHDNMNFLYHTSFVSVTQERVIETWMARFPQAAGS